MGAFIFVCSLICLTIAGDKYYSAIATANELAETMPGFNLESVDIPTVTWVCGTIGVMLLVAGVILIANSFRQIESDL